MINGQVTVTLDMAAATWLAEEVARHFFYGQMEIQDLEHFRPMAAVYEALLNAGVPEPERESVKNMRSLEDL